jgi:hypothetical protein
VSQINWRTPPEEFEEKVNWHWYWCRGCRKPGDAHMISLQAKLELCNNCYNTLPEEWRKKRGEPK